MRGQFPDSNLAGSNNYGLRVGLIVSSLQVLCALPIVLQYLMPTAMMLAFVFLFFFLIWFIFWIRYVWLLVFFQKTLRMSSVA